MAEIDREKVIKGLETCSDVFYGCKGACSSCDYSQMEKCFGELVYDAIALLKEQEAEIRQLRLALDIAKGTCKGIVVDRR